MEQSDSPNKAIIAIVVIALIAFAAGATIVLTSRPDAQDSISQIADDAPTNAPVTFEADATFVDGTYDATGNYQTPGGREQIGVKVTLKDGVVTDAELTEMGTTGEAKEYQSRFASGYKPQVIGKKISEIKLDRVAGSSLTSVGFNDAINDIAQQSNA